MVACLSLPHPFCPDFDTKPTSGAVAPHALCSGLAEEPCPGPAHSSLSVASLPSCINEGPAGSFCTGPSHSRSVGTGWCTPHTLNVLIKALHAPKGGKNLAQTQGGTRPTSSSPLLWPHTSPPVSGSASRSRSFDQDTLQQPGPHPWAPSPQPECWAGAPAPPPCTGVRRPAPSFRLGAARCPHGCMLPLQSEQSQRVPACSQPANSWSVPGSLTPRDWQDSAPSFHLQRKACIDRNFLKGIISKGKTTKYNISPGFQLLHETMRRLTPHHFKQARVPDMGQVPECDLGRLPPRQEEGRQ